MQRAMSSPEDRARGCWCARA